MLSYKAQQIFEAIAVEKPIVNSAAPAEEVCVLATVVEPPAQKPKADDAAHNPLEERPILDQDGANDDGARRNDPEGRRGRTFKSTDGPALLWTMDEEAVLKRSSEAGLRRIRTRLENLLLGVSHALRIRETCGGPLEPDESRSGSAGLSKHRPSLDFAESVLVADHAIRRIVGEAFYAFEEDEVVQMVQLCSLADRGPGDCDELVRNAVVVLQALTHGGEAVRNVKHFRKFVTAYREEIASEQWSHDYVTALRSLAVGFLREPFAIMEAHSSSINQIVENEALYVGLLRLCGERPLGNTPYPKEMPDSLGASLLSVQPSSAAPSRQLCQQHQYATRADPNKSHASSSAKHSSIYIHTPKKSNTHTRARRPLSAPQQHRHQLSMPSAEDLENAIELLIGSSSSNYTLLPNKPGPLKDSFVDPTPAQLHEVQEPANKADPAITSELRASASCARTEKPKPVYEPLAGVPQRLSLHRGRVASVSHY
ncbi:hypothetical protein ABL78_3511 [Leptomonas seymouri]|uniref:Uncharacterized protein n=1 Tax=Leptomonas seymouri TaxID=5684 RepID=A0A0N0P6Q1_LEPSE|nr:hypothetical protein ABL78_3511 [Leptomonas seymouri]|eukprot:KPI87427.1 hypothetical protein ABL78_3511 [Leptomonas seymouri]